MSYQQQKDIKTSSLARRFQSSFTLFIKESYHVTSKISAFSPLPSNFPNPPKVEKVSTVEPRYNDPLYNEVLSITNDFVYPSNCKVHEKGPQYHETSL